MVEKGSGELHLKPLINDQWPGCVPVSAHGGVSSQMCLDPGSSDLRPKADATASRARSHCWLCSTWRDGADASPRATWGDYEVGEVSGGHVVLPGGNSGW